MDWFEDINDELEDLLADALAKGLPVEALPEVISKAVAGQGGVMAKGLLETATEQARERDDQDHQFASELREDWGEAFDLYMTVLATIDDTYAMIHHRCMHQWTEPAQHVYASLMARGVRTGWEIRTLLNAGYGQGALARSRTLHEISVVASFINQHNDSSDVAERYMEHRVVDVHRRITAHQPHADSLGVEPFPEDEVREADEELERVLDKYGKSFRGPYGWADGIIRNGNPGIEQLAAAAGRDFMAPYSRWAHHEVHPTSHGDDLNLRLDGDVEYRVTGAETNGFTEAAEIALISLQLVFAVAAGTHEEMKPMDVVMLAAVDELVEAARSAFVETELRLA